MAPQGLAVRIGAFGLWLMASTISAARGALYDRLVTAAANGASPLFGVQISWGDPLSYEEQEVVALGGVSDPTADLDTLGGGHIEESYTILVPWKVHGPEDDARTVDARGYAIAGGIQAVVDADRTFGDVVLLAVADGGRSDKGAEPAQGGGFVIFGTSNVTCLGTP